MFSFLYKFISPFTHKKRLLLLLSVAFAVIFLVLLIYAMLFLLFLNKPLITSKQIHTVANVVAANAAYTANTTANSGVMLGETNSAALTTAEASIALSVAVINSSLSIDFTFPLGMPIKTLVIALYRNDILTHPIWFMWLVKAKGKATALHAGEYKVIADVTTPMMLINMMIKGEVVRHSFTIVEGWTFAQLKAALAVNSYLKHELQGLDDTAIMTLIGHAGEMPEGRFAPETYVFSGKVSEVTILRNAYQRMQKQLEIAWQNAHSVSQTTQQMPQSQTNINSCAVCYGLLPNCPYAALIIASMIEKESAYSKERPLIAGVIMRRLQLGMPLQIDATVIYGLEHIFGESFKRKLQASDLQKDTAYNTYIHRGLPPTPIAMPSVDAIFAALHPIIGKEIYYVAKGDGSHVFSKTLAEHAAARKKYLR